MGIENTIFLAAVALLFMVTLFGNMISWSMGVNSTAAYAADNGDMPAVFKKRWAKNDMPTGAALMNGVIATVIAVIGVILTVVAPESDLFWTFFSLNLVLFLMSYLPVFPAFLKLRRVDPDTERPFRVPGGSGMLKAMAIIPMILIALSIVFTAVPLSADAVAGTLPITIGAVICIVLGELLIMLRGKKQ